MRINIKNINRDILEYLLMLIVFAFGQSVFIRMIDSPSRYVYFDLAAIGIVFILNLLENQIKKIDYVHALMHVMYVVIYFILTWYGQETIIYNICLPFFLFYLYLSAQFRRNRQWDFVKKYSDITVVFAFVSIIMYIFGTVLNSLPYQMDTYSWAGVTKTTKNYFHLMYEAQTEVFFGQQFIRNCGIFCEAPSYAVPLTLSFFIELFLSSRLKFGRLAILGAAAVTSFSSKALSIILVIIAMKVLIETFRRKKRNSLLSLIKLFSPVFLVLAVAVFISVIGQKAESASALTRIDGIAACLTAFKHSPILGVGVGNESSIAQYITVFLSWKGFATGAPILLAQGGIVLTAFYLYGMFRCIIHARDRKIATAFIVTQVLLLMTSNIPYFLSMTFVTTLEYVIPQRVFRAVNGGRKEN